MNALELTTIINTLANVLAGDLTQSETALLASILVQLGDTLATITARDALL